MLAQDSIANLVPGKEDRLTKLTRRLAHQEDFSRLLQDTADIVVLIQDDKGRVLSINRFGKWLCGRPVQDIVRKPFIQLLAEQPDDLGESLTQLIGGHHQSYRHEAALLQQSGEPVMLAWWHTIWHVGRHRKRVVTIGLDVSDQRIAEEHIGWLASHDPLTGLFNRRRFFEEGRRWLGQRGAPSPEFALMLLDLDQFRDINDLQGHQQGDRLLQQVSRLLRKELRDSDIIARLGGDEFGILLKTDRLDAIQNAAQRCCDALRGISIEQGNTQLPVSTSIGIALSPAHGTSMEELLGNADIAMYEAKSRGRSAWHLYDGDTPYRERIHERAFWDTHVRSALSSTSLEMHFQPIMDIKSNTIVHHEALLRLRDQSGDFLSTPELINAAERGGMIHQLDELVVEQVIGHLAELDTPKVKVRFALNLSGLSFQNPRLIEHIQQVLKRHKVKPAQVIFEITETAALADITSAIDTMNAIKALGCRFALDDFGVGFSSLYYLKKLPIDFVKIDGSFVQNIHKDKEHQVIIRALVDVARAFRLKTIAEFVEDEQTLDMLRVLGVDYAQGYHIDRPLPFDHVRSFLASAAGGD